MAYPRQMGVVVIAVTVAADPHHQQGHLLVPVQQVPVGAVLDGVRAHGAGVDGAHRVFKIPVALLRRALVGAEDAVVFPGEGVADAVLQQGAGAHDDGGLAEVFQHGAELLLDVVGELAVQQQLLQGRGHPEIVLRGHHLGAVFPDIVLHGVGVEHVRADEVGVVGLDAALEELRVCVPDDVAGQQHAHGLAADTAGTHLPPLDLHQVPDGEVLAAELQALGLGAQQAAQDVLLQGHAVRVRGLGAAGLHGVEHAVPAVPVLAGLGEDVEEGVSVRAGGEDAAVGPVHQQGEVHGGRVAPLHLHGVDVAAAVLGADVQQHICGVADAGDGLVGVPLIAQGNVGDGLPRPEKVRRQAEEVADHGVGKPELLQIRDTVQDEEGVLRLGADDPVDLDGEGLEAHGGVQIVLADVGAPAGQGLRGHHLRVPPEAQIHDAPPGEGHAGDELGGDEDEVADAGHLPGHGVPGPQIVQGPVQGFDAGGDADLIAHGTCLLI